MKETAKYPPKLALSLFRWYCRPDRAEELEGDLLEIYDLRLAENKSKWIVDLQFWWNVIRCFKSYSRKSKYFMDTSGALYKSYAKLAVRQMLKNKGPILINIFGLGLSLGFCITVYMIYAYNWEFDAVYENENIFRIHGLKTVSGELYHYEDTPLAIELALETDLAAVKDVVSYHLNKPMIKKGDEFFSDYFAYASPGFLEHFDIPLKYGNVKSLHDPSAIYLNEDMAIKLFGDVSPVGEVVTIYMPNNAKVEATVQGVFYRLQLNSSFLFNGLMSAEVLIKAYDVDKTDWSSDVTFAQFAVLSGPENRQSVEEHLQKYIPIQNEAREQWKLEDFQLIPFRDDIINDAALAIRHSNARVRYEAIMIFTVMGVLILFIACFNMANTTMALISKRVKEIGVRKTLGSFNHQIFTQFLFEMLITMALAFLLALVMSNTIATEVWGLFEVKFFLQDIDTTGVAIFIGCFLLLCTLITGLFPALYAWRFQPVSILNHKQSLKGVGILHKILTVAQYSFSITALIAGLAFTSNVDFLRTMDYGYRVDDTLLLNIDDQNEYLALKEKLDQLPFVESSFGSVHHIGSPGRSILLEKDTTKIEVSNYKVGHEMIPRMEIEILQGRNFIEGSEGDIQNNVLVNKRFADLYFPGEDPLNKVVKLEGERRTIVGITDDFIQDEVFEDYRPEPFVFYLVPLSDYKKLIVNTKGIPNKEAEKTIAGLWANTIDRPFMKRWQEDVALGDSMKATNQIRTLFLWLAGLGCILSLIGIMSLASLNVAKKTKEISIRKVLGASLSQILVSINKPFMRILALSLVVGVGLGWFISDTILSTIYLYYLDISVIEGVPIGLFIVIAALVMTSVAVFKRASDSPTVGLRSE